MRKLATILLIVCALGLGGAVYWLYTTNDRLGPEIRFPEEPLIYEEGMDSGVLLEGVEAYDESDGDVTENLLIEKIYSTEDGCYVIYTAKDSSNNVTKAKRFLSDSPETDLNQDEKSGSQAKEPDKEDSSSKEEEQGDRPKETSKNSQKEEQEDSQKKETAKDSPKEDQEDIREENEENPETTPASAPADIKDSQTDEKVLEEKARQEQEAAIDSLPPQFPRIYLNTYYLHIKKGDPFNVLDYVKDIEDDKDNHYDLWKTVMTDGIVDSNTSGTYEIACYVLDSDGNYSNRAVLKVVVE